MLNKFIIEVIWVVVHQLPKNNKSKYILSNCLKLKNRIKLLKRLRGNKTLQEVWIRAKQIAKLHKIIKSRHFVKLRIQSRPRS